MMDILRTLMVRLFAGGILCAAAMALAGGGARRESVRLCCVCAMMLIVLSPMEGADLALLPQSRAEVEHQIQLALAGHGETRLEAIARRLESHISDIAGAESISCIPVVQCRLDENGALVIESIALRCESADMDACSRLAARIAADFGITPGQIVWMEDDAP